MREWSVNDFCLAPYPEDSSEYEAQIKDILEDSSGCKYAVINYVEYDEEGTCWMDDLKPSKSSEEEKAPEGSKSAENGVEFPSKDQPTEKEALTLNAVEELSSPGSVNGGGLRSETPGPQLSLLTAENEVLKEEVEALKDRLAQFGVSKKEMEEEGRRLKEEVKDLSNKLLAASKSPRTPNGPTSLRSNSEDNSLSGQESIGSNSSTSFSTLLGHDKYASPPFKSKVEENHSILLDQGPINMGKYNLQPVLCYFPIVDKLGATATTSSSPLVQGRRNIRG